MVFFLLLFKGFLFFFSLPCISSEILQAHRPTRLLVVFPHLMQSNYKPLDQTVTVYFVILFAVDLLPSELVLISNLAKFTQRQYSMGNGTLY